MTVSTAIIPVAGLGTRMLPATKAIPKEMLPIADKPLIQYIIEECALAGIKNIVLVTHSSKNSIEDHFDVSFELESTLEKRLKRQLLAEVQAITPEGLSIMHIRQGKPLGLGHAVLVGKKIVGDNPFAVVLPDVLINRFDADLSASNLKTMLDRFEQTGSSQIMVESVAPDEVENYGIADIGGKAIADGEVADIQDLVEKPAQSEAPSDLSVVGRYVFSADIWPLLKQTEPGVGDEIQLTDAIRGLLDSHKVEAFKIQGKSHDCGSKLGYFATNLEYVLRSERFGEDFKPIAQGLVESYGD